MNATTKARLLTFFGLPVLRVLGRSWRVTEVDEPTLGDLLGGAAPRLVALPHGRLIVPAYVYRGLGVGVMVSRHRDGELIARVISKLGFRTYRGSTTRGGSAALREMGRETAGVPLALTPDGPRGPAGVVQPGIVALASLTGRRIVPLGIAADPAWRMRSWDRFLVPKPFARVRIVAGTPLAIPGDIGKDEIPVQAKRVAEAMLDADRRAWEDLGVADPVAQPSS